MEIFTQIFNNNTTSENMLIIAYIALLILGILGLFIAIIRKFLQNVVEKGTYNALESYKKNNESNENPKSKAEYGK